MDLVIKMKKYTIELNDDLSAIYADIAKINHKSIEEALQIILRRVIETMLQEKSSTTPAPRYPSPPDRDKPEDNGADPRLWTLR